MTVASLTAPVHWAIAAAIAVLLLAPGLMPPTARLAGRIAGVLLRTSRRPGRSRYLKAPETTDNLSSSADPFSTGHVPIWAVALMVVFAVAVLSWWLFHSR